MSATRDNTVRQNQGGKLSLVLPVFNEVAILRELTELLHTSMRTLGHEYEIIFVNDGSVDGSSDLLDLLTANDNSIIVVHLSRNFGHQPAVHAGLQHASGQAVILMDSDMQDDPGAIGNMIEKWKKGFDVVYAVRTKRKESLVKRLLFHSFHRLMSRLSSVAIPKDAGNFGLLDRSVVDHILAIGDHERYLPGLRSWVGFRQIGVPVERLARHDDTPRVSIWQLFQLAKTAVFGFSNAPMSVFAWLTGGLSLIFGACLLALAYHGMLSLPIPRGLALVTLVSFFATVNSLGLAIIGEYVLRIHDQVRGRPRFIVARTAGNLNNRSQSEVKEDLNTSSEAAVLDQVNAISSDLGKATAPVTIPLTGDSPVLQ